MKLPQKPALNASCKVGEMVLDFAAKAFKKPKIKQPMIFTENVPKGKFKRIGLSNLDNPKRETPPSALPIAMLKEKEKRKIENAATDWFL